MALRRYQNIPRRRAAFEGMLRILRESRIDELYIRELSRQISYISDTTCGPIERQTEASRIEDRGSKIASSRVMAFLDLRSSILLGLRNSDRPADHQAARDEEERDRPVKVETEEVGGVEIASTEEEHEQSEGNDAGRDRRPFEIFDFARCRRERIGGDVVARQTAQSADRKIDQDDLIQPGVEADSERDRRGGDAE